jgi:hypothetical protein
MMSISAVGCSGFSVDSFTWSHLVRSLHWGRLRNRKRYGRGNPRGRHKLAWDKFRQHSRHHALNVKSIPQFHGPSITASCCEFQVIIRPLWKHWCVTLMASFDHEAFVLHHFHHNVSLSPIIDRHEKIWFPFVKRACLPTDCNQWGSLQPRKPTKPGFLRSLTEFWTTVSARLCLWSQWTRSCPFRFGDVRQALFVQYS